MSTNLLDWSDSFNTGIKEVDSQHKTLVKLLNQLHQAIQQHQSKDASRQILDELADYTHTHFSLEESLMRMSHYADYPSHKKQHADLIGQVQALQQKLDSGQASIGFELLHFLKTWLTHHISESDKRFGAYFVLSDASSEGSATLQNWTGEVEKTMAEKKRWWKFW